MSEFKYACPVCGQHISCDSSQAGSVMDCPTCFQKIVVPQAPASDGQKFILTGSKLTEKKTSVPAASGGVVAPEKKFPVAAVLAVLLLAGVAGAAALVFHGRIFNSAGPVTPPDTAASHGDKSHPKKPPEKPALVAPPASDANWILALGTNAIPDVPVAGRIHAQDFIMEHASFSTNGTLTIRAGSRGAVEFGAFVNFGGAQAESLSGQTLNVTAGAEKAARVQLRWKDAGGAAQRRDFTNGYAMRLEFGPLANKRLPGKIYLCTPDDEKSYLLGAFTASVSKPRPPK